MPDPQIPQLPGQPQPAPPPPPIQPQVPAEQPPEESAIPEPELSIPEDGTMSDAILERFASADPTQQQPPAETPPQAPPQAPPAQQPQQPPTEQQPAQPTEAEQAFDALIKADPVLASKIESLIVKEEQDAQAAEAQNAAQQQPLPTGKDFGKEADLQLVSVASNLRVGISKSMRAFEEKRTSVANLVHQIENIDAQIMDHNEKGTTDSRIYQETIEQRGALMQQYKLEREMAEKAAEHAKNLEYGMQVIEQAKENATHYPEIRPWLVPYSVALREGQLGGVPIESMTIQQIKQRLSQMYPIPDQPQTPTQPQNPSLYNKLKQGSKSIASRSAGSGRATGGQPRETENKFYDPDVGLAPGAKEFLERKW